MELAPGTLLKQQQYQVQTTLGKGGFGITYRGIDLKSSRTVAIKENWPESGVRQGTTVIWPHHTTRKQQQEELQKFKGEAQYLSQCIHPNIVKVYDWFEENNTAYTVMEFIKGRLLSDLFEAEGLLPENRIQRYLMQIAAALQVIHAKNLLHRDIKPENIIITAEDRAILIDFGATREFIAGKTGRMTAILTPGYAPLEQYSVTSKRGAGTDIYALCASMYHLLTGQWPPEPPERYPADSLIPPRQIVPSINPHFEQILLIGMARKLENRFQSVTALMQALNSIIETHNARLVFIHNRELLAEFSLTGDRTIIGRSDLNTGSVHIDLNPLVGNETVSRRHGQIYRDGKQWKISDLGSQNGIFIKRSGQPRFGAKITSPEPLFSGDEIAFGKVRCLFQIF